MSTANSHAALYPTMLLHEIQTPAGGPRRSSLHASPHPRKVRALSGNHLHFTQPVADVIEYVMLTYVRRTSSYVKDPDSIIRTFTTMQVPSDCQIFTFDVVSLYDRIPHVECIDFNLRHLHRHDDQRARLIGALLHFVLDNNFCAFGSDFYRQIVGFATGVSCAGSVAHIFLEELWYVLFHNESRLEFHGRYIDDGIGLFNGSISDLRSFLALANDSHPNIDITHDVNHFYVVFLDIVFFRGPQWDATGFLDTDLYDKPCNQHLFFCFKSEHPAACKRGLVIGELTRYIKRCSSEYLFYGHAIELWHYFRCRGYPAKFLALCFDSAPTFSERDALLLRSTLDSIDPERPDRLHVFVSEYSYVKSKMNFGDIMHTPAHLLPTSLQQEDRKLGWRAASLKLRNLVTFRFNFPLDENGQETPSSL
jgi:hypothetical protein